MIADCADGVPEGLFDKELSDRGAWGLLQHFFSPERHLAVCVLYKEQRYSLRAYHFQGQDVLEHAARVLRLDASRLAACDFHIGDLDVQGDCCPIAVALEAVAAVSSEESGTDEDFSHSGAPGVWPAGVLQDATLPDGHSWNISLASVSQDAPAPSEDDVPIPFDPQPSDQWQSFLAEVWEDADRSDSIAPVDRTTRDYEDLAEQSQALEVPMEVDPGFEVEVPAFVYVPDMVPEALQAKVEIPCAVDSLVRALSFARQPSLLQCFACLTPVVPQPCSSFVILLATPDWLVDRPTVLLDCSRVNQAMYACTLFHSCNRESLLCAAGFRHDSDVGVFVHGLLSPLSPGQVIRLFTGMLVSFAPPGAGAPSIVELSTRLLSRHGWDTELGPPGPDYHPGQHFWLLTDAQPERFTVGPWLRGHFFEDVCEQLRAAPHRLSLTVARPNIADAFPKGFLTSGVIVATERTSVMRAGLTLILLTVLVAAQEARDRQAVLALEDRLPPRLGLGIREIAADHGLVVAALLGILLLMAPVAVLSKIVQEMLRTCGGLAWPIPDGSPSLPAPPVPAEEDAAEDFLDVVDTCRALSGKDLFPQLCLPDWLQTQVVVCMDLTCFDGRLFAAHSPTNVDRHMLANLAGLSGAAPVDIYVGGHDAPVVPGDDVALQSGCCVTFVPRGSVLEPSCYLGNMLRTHLGWAAGPAFPQAAPEDRVCAVGEGQYCDFLMLPERAAFLYADIASRLQLPVNRLWVTPASPQVRDSALYGRLSRTVVGFGASFRRDPAQRIAVALLDCRPILEGWIRVPSDEGWLDIRGLRNDLLKGAPPELDVRFSGCLAHWNWLWVEDGQVVQVTYAATDTDATIPLPGFGQDAGDSPLVAEDAADSVPSQSSAIPGARDASQDTYPSAHPSHDPASHGFTWDLQPSSPGNCQVFARSLLDMWTAESSRHALLLGTLWLTSVVAAVCWKHSFLACLLFGALRFPRAPLLLRVVLIASACSRLNVVTAVQFRFPDHSDALSCPSAACVRAPSLAPICPVHELAVRTLPTPCRSWSGTPCVDEGADRPLEVDLDGTLLEQAILAPDCEAFFLAATLLDTLIEHFDSQPGATGVLSPSPALISLEQLLVTGIEELCTGMTLEPTVALAEAVSEAEVFDLDARQCQLPCGSTAVRDLFACSSFSALLSVPDGLFKPERFEAWVCQGSLGRSLAPEEMLVLTSDGSFSAEARIAGWAVSVSAVSSHTLRLPGQFLGCFGGSLAALSPFLPHGTLLLDPYIAEVAGLLYAGDEANELADALASYFACTRRFASPFCLDLSYWCDQQSARSQWLSHICMTLSRAAEFPALHEDVHSWSQGSGVCSHPPEFAMAPFLRDVVQGPAVQEARAVQLCLVSYNVLSLLGDVPSVQPASDGLHGATGRVVLLSRVFEAKEVLVAGLQECRTPRGSMTCGPYRRLASGCDSAACFGVELWIHRHSPIEAMSAVILHAEPTLLIASATFAGESIRLLVGHAPHRVHTEAVRRDWWERALRLCRTFSGAAPWILLMDANARLGSETSSAVGSWEVDVQDLSGEMLHQLLSYLASWIPATFSSCALGDGHTLYQKRNATFARSDYVGVPLAWSVGTLQAWVDPEISAGHMCIDLFAAVVALRATALRCVFLAWNHRELDFSELFSGLALNFASSVELIATFMFRLDGFSNRSAIGSQESLSTWRSHFADLEDGEGLSCAVMFLDLMSAYYGVIRETVMGSGLGDRPLSEIASSLSLTSEDLQLLRHYVSCEPVLQSQDAGALLSELTREMHSSTWFILSQDDKVVNTHRGTRPGGALADIVFNVLFSKVLQRRDLSGFRHAIPTIPWDGHRAPFSPIADVAPVPGVPQTVGDVVYADDLASLVVSDTADGLRSALCGVAAATLDVLGPHGLRPNYGPKKTAAIVAVQGRGSRKVRRVLFGDLRAKLPVFLENSGAVRIDLVTHYKHLGSHLSFDGSLLPEVKYRLALGRASFKEGTWPWLSASEWSAFSGHDQPDSFSMWTAFADILACYRKVDKMLALFDSSARRLWSPCVTSADDETIFGIVKNHIAPLPVLRLTLQQWVDSLPDGALQAAGRDVLLILHAEHLCSRISGQAPGGTEPSPAFSPAVYPLPATLPVATAHVAWIGHLCPRWVDTWGLVSLPPAVLTWPLGQSRLLSGAAAVCCHVPDPPFPFSRASEPAPCQLRSLRANRVWLDQVLASVELLLERARAGAPVLVRIPVPVVGQVPVTGYHRSAIPPRVQELILTRAD
ncbi:unnamed protein product, partial [Symbiodinium sp. KB8]